MPPQPCPFTEAAPSLHTLLGLGELTGRLSFSSSVTRDVCQGSRVSKRVKVLICSEACKRSP